MDGREEIAVGIGLCKCVAFILVKEDTNELETETWVLRKLDDDCSCSCLVLNDDNQLTWRIDELGALLDENNFIIVMINILLLVEEDSLVVVESTEVGWKLENILLIVVLSNFVADFLWYWIDLCVKLGAWVNELECF